MNKIRYSLVLATLGRQDTVGRFLESVTRQTYGVSAVEIIIVDQNRDGLLDDIVASYAQRLNIKHIKSPVLGLSLNRNRGIECAVGDILAFPDDDCQYPDDLLERVDAGLRDESVDFLLGKIWDPEQDIPAIRKWPEREIRLNRFNFYRLTSSITLFARNRGQRFDERFGLGAKFGSNEDAIFVFSMLTGGARGEYCPQIRVFHEDQPMSALEPKKVMGYAVGFGRFIREYRCPATLAIFIASVGFQAIGWAKALLSLDFRTASLRSASLRGRISGLLG